MMMIQCCCTESGIHQYIEAQIVCPCLPSREKLIECAGRIFHEVYDTVASSSNSYTSSDEPMSKTNNVVNEKHHKKKEYRQVANKNKQALPVSIIRSLAKHDKTLYQLMEIGEEVGQDEIKKKFKELVLRIHPDKLGNLEGDEKENARLKFISVQEAYEILSDTEMRRAYDSSLPFEPKLPAIPKTEEEFLKVFGDCFKAWGRFSTVKPLPDIGDAETSIENVRAFYTFYSRMESWRDYSYVDEYDLSEAHDKDEKWWMQTQNKKSRQNAIRADNSMIKNLLELAQKHDPRIRRNQIELQAKQDLLNIAKKEREEAKRAEDGERLRKLYANIQGTSKDKEYRETDAEKKEKRDVIIETIKDYMREKGVNSDRVHPIDIECMIKQQLWDYGKTQKYLDEIRELDKDPLEDKLYAEFREYKDTMNAKTKGVFKKRTPQAPRVAAVWTPDEISLFVKACKKFPGGTHGRWQKISDMVGTKTVRDVQDRSTSLQQNMKKNVNTNVADQWTPQQQKALEDAVKEFGPTLEAKDRWTRIGEAVEGKTAKECLERARELQGKTTKK